MHHPEKEANVLSQLFQALPFPLRLAVTDGDEGDHRGHIQHGQGLGVLLPNFPGLNELPKNPRVILDHPVHISLGIHGTQLRRAELLNGHHLPKPADDIVVKGIFKNLPHLLEKRLLCDMHKG